MCIVRRGLRHVERKVASSKQAVSVMFCGNAAGQFLPPMTVYKSKNLYAEWTRNGPQNALYDHSVSGWFDASCLKNGFLACFWKLSRILQVPRLCWVTTWPLILVKLFWRLVRKMTLSLLACFPMPRISYNHWMSVSLGQVNKCGVEFQQNGGKRVVPKIPFRRKFFLYCSKGSVLGWMKSRKIWLQGLKPVEFFQKTEIKCWSDCHLPILSQCKKCLVMQLPLCLRIYFTKTDSITKTGSQDNSRSSNFIIWYCWFKFISI